MKNYINMSTSIRFVHHLWSILEFLTTLKISFRKGLQDSFILLLFIPEFSMEKKRMDMCERDTRKSTNYAK